MKQLAKTRAIGAAVAVACAFGAPAALGADIDLGLYRLHNHGDGDLDPPPYGLRLDELFDVTDSVDRFTFDFDHPDAGMFMEYDGNSIHIFGTAFGGRDMGLGYDPDWTSLVTIDFTYTMVDGANGDDDIVSSEGSGTITWEETGQTFDLNEKVDPSQGYAFRFGDDQDDTGHRGVAGLSGWGWLMVDDLMLPGQQDWLFTAELLTIIPLPPAAWTGLAGLVGVAWLRRRKLAASA